jgi:glycosyltransferase involved in cell wall biosynthesis
MASIIMADTTGRYDGRDLETRPLGGTEANVILCARELVRRGHQVTVHTNCDTDLVHEGVRWRPLADTPDPSCDAYVAIQHPHLLGFVPHARRRAIWVLWGANQLRHYKRFWRMWLHRPIPILLSQYQVSDYWPVMPSRDRMAVIPHPLPADVRGHASLPAAPGRRAIFASNPTRNLRSLAEIWIDRILPRAPGAVLDVYGVHELAPDQDAWTEWAGTLLPAGASEEAKRSIVVHPTAARAQLIEAMRASRAMLYLGHKCEAFCMSLAEAQALGVPAVVAPVAVLPERVVDGVTGFHHADPARFADAAVRLLTDDALWRAQHEAALALQQGITCAEQAELFEQALFGPVPPGRMHPRAAAA